MTETWYVKQPVTVTIGGARLDGVIVSFPSRKVEFATRPVGVKIGPAEYVRVDLSALEAKP